MVKLLTFLAVALFATPLFAGTTIELQDRNTVVLRGSVSTDNMAKVLNELMEKDAKLPEGEPLYLFIDSPGGSITAGIEFIEGAKSIHREIKTITSFSASMAFMIVQNMGERLVTPFGILMSHRARGGIDGQIPGELDTAYHFWKQYIDRSAEGAAKRLNMSTAQLEQKHRDEWWTAGPQAVKEGTADKVVSIECGETMRGTVKQQVSTFFGNIDVVYAKCPLIKAPIKVSFGGIRAMNETEDKEFNEIVHMYFFDEQRYLKEFVVSGKQDKVFK